MMAAACRPRKHWFRSPPSVRGGSSTGNFAAEQVRAFVEGSEAVDFASGDRAGVYTVVRRTLVKRYLAKVTGLSRAQLTRLIGQHRRTGRVEDWRGVAPA